MFSVRDASERAGMQTILAWFQSCSSPKEKTPERFEHFAQMCGTEGKERAGEV